LVNPCSDCGFNVIHVNVIGYFLALTEVISIPYENLINLYLRECAQTRKKAGFSRGSCSPPQTGEASPELPTS
jgi:hypothetical protein